MTTEQILAVQAIAVATDNYELLCTAYSALGVSRRYAFVTVSDWERARAQATCEAYLATHPHVYPTLAA